MVLLYARVYIYTYVCKGWLSSLNFTALLQRVQRNPIQTRSNVFISCHVFMDIGWQISEKMYFTCIHIHTCISSWSLDFRLGMYICTLFLSGMSFMIILHACILFARVVKRKHLTFRLVLISRNNCFQLSLSMAGRLRKVATYGISYDNSISENKQTLCTHLSWWSMQFVEFLADGGKVTIIK